MPNWTTITRWALGLFLITCGGFAYLDEERRLKNRLCEIWFRLTSASERAIAGVVAATGFMLRTLEAAMAWLYGPRVISLRGLWTGLMLSLASLPILFGAFFLIEVREYHQLVEKHGLLIVSVAVACIVGVAGLVTWGLFIAATLPSKLRRFRFTLVDVADLGARSLISTTVIVWYLKVLLALVEKVAHPWAAIALTLTFGTLENLISMSILRWAGRQWEEGRRKQGGRRIASALVVIAACYGALVILVRAPLWMAHLHGIVDIRSMTLLLSVLTNAVEVVLVLGLLVFVVFFVLHAAAWNALLRLAEKFHIELPKKAIVAVGILVLTGQPIWKGLQKAFDIPDGEVAHAPMVRDAGHDSASPPGSRAR